ncbi:MbtH family NRPS accessory protein [Streptomyces decoyicus]|uniref:MbtH family NRPS accessory protein n=1 Tax=Streptomyces decoyicus TaxID=249567 RepID=UPI00345CF4E4
MTRPSPPPLPPPPSPPITPSPPSAPSAPFDPGPDGHDTHLVLENTQGHLSLWPAWRITPDGWLPRFGPAPHDACTRLVEERRG